MRLMQSSVPMFVYIEMASYVKIQAFGGKCILSSSCFKANESLKYVAWSFTIG